MPSKALQMCEIAIAVNDCGREITCLFFNRDCGMDFEPSDDDKLIDRRLRVPTSVWSRLYGYQRTGVHWLWELHCQQAGGVVGDEMGLGKTIQMIAFLAALRVSRLRSHVTR